MSEVIKDEPVQGELMTAREVMEGYPTDVLVDYVLQMGTKASDIERTMNVAAQILEKRGTSITEELRKRVQSAEEI